MNAANAKPERPRFEEQARLNKSVNDMQNESSSKSRKVQEDMYGELSEKWKGQKGGSSGDSFVTGLTAGLKEGSFMDDKKRSQQLIKFNEQMRDMVANQNIELFEKEKLHNAKQSMAPRIMAYLDKYQKMSPNDRKVYLQNSMDEYNKAADTDYKITDAIGSEPWKVIVSDGEGLQQIDLMEFIQTPEEQKLKYYLESEDAKGYEQELQNEDRLKREILENNAASSKYKSEAQNPANIQEKKRALIESGKIPEGALLFEELPQGVLKTRVKFMEDSVAKMKDTENGLEALYGIGKVLKDNPNISTSFAKWANEKDPGLATNFLREISDQKVRNALKELEKHADVLAVGAISQFKGQRPTDILKKLLAGTVPGKDFTYDAYQAIAPSIEKRYKKQLNESKENAKGFNYGYAPPFIIDEASVVEVPAQESERDKIIREIEEIEARRQNGR